MTDKDANKGHKAAMIRRKAEMDALIAQKTLEKRGLLMVNTGAGKGKSTAAFGLMLRMLGHGRKVAVIQFIKGAWMTGERRSAEKVFGEQLLWHVMGEGFTWNIQDRERDIRACRRGWDKAMEFLTRDDIALVVLDELNIALRYEYIALDEVLRDIAGRPKLQHVVITGRDAPQELLQAADLVTEMRLVKHHFDSGIPAQRGIEY